MSTLPEVITLGPEDEARRLWAGALEAAGRAADDLIALCQMLDLGLRAAEISVIQRLQPVKSKFPATIALQLDTPDPEIDAYRDAVTEPKALEFCEIVDLLSEEGLECVGPGLHRGWEDRRFSCGRSRGTAQAALGISLNAEEQRHALLLAAHRNRIFRYPPPVRITPAAVIEAFGSLKKLVKALSAC